MWVTRRENNLRPLLFDVRRTQGGIPTDANTGRDIVASGELPAESIAVSRPFDPPSSTGGYIAPAAIIDLYSPHLAPAFLIQVDLSSFDIRVSQGEVLAIVLRTEDPHDFRGLGYVWHGKSPGEYPRGSHYHRSHADNLWHTLDPFGSLANDQAFRTYVRPIPEPRAEVLWLAAGLCGWMGSTNRLRRSRPKRRLTARTLRTRFGIASLREVIGLFR
jgi:hypothetical protein